MQIEPRRPKLFHSAEKIAEYIGENAKYINQLVIEEDLPAWKRRGKGPWKALDIDLDKWMLAQRAKYLPKSRDDAKVESRI